MSVLAFVLMVLNVAWSQTCWDDCGDANVHCVDDAGTASGYEHTTISAAITAATAADLVCVDDGSYDELLTVDKNLSIESRHGSEYTFLTKSGAVTTSYSVVYTEFGKELYFEGFDVTSTNMRAFGGAATITLHLTDVFAHDMRQRDDGGALLCDSCTVFIDDSVFQDNDANDDGGHIHARDASSVTITNTEFIRGEAENGGAIYMPGSTSELEITNTTFKTYAASATGENKGDGGAIISAGEVTITNSSFDGTNAAGEVLANGNAENGGAIYMSGPSSVLYATSTTFSGNWAKRGLAYTGYGGAILAREAHIDDCTFTANTGGGNGGAIEAEFGYLTIRDSAFTDNEVTSTSGGVGYGGAVSLYDPPVSGSGEDEQNLISGTTFDSNSAGFSAGAVFVYAPSGGDLVIAADSVFVDNAAPYAGALNAYQTSSLEITDTTLEYNLASSGDGGGLYVLEATAVDYTRVMLCANEAGDDGGGIYSEDVVDELWQNVLFVENYATDDGGGAFVDTDGDLTVRNTTFLGNDVGDKGGGLWLRDSSESGTLDFEFVNNVVAATRAGRGVNASDYATLVVQYNDWHGNAPAHRGGDLNDETLDSTNLPGNPDPELKTWSEDLDCSNDELWPVWGSPLVDAGTGTDPDGTTADIGAYGGPNADPDLFENNDSDSWIVMFDCDDSNGDVYIGADEYCDGTDYDCDGETYEADSVDATTYYDDHDEDTYGDHTDSTSACAGYQPAGWVTDDNDCDDNDFDEKPGVWWYPDADEDGQGESGGIGIANECSREEPDDVTNHTDCDDDDPNTYEGADEICDGLVNECGSTLPDDESDLDEDLYVECEFHTDGWQGDEDIVGDEDCDDDDDEEYPGVTWYADSDEDGQGDAGSTSECARAASTDVLNSTDCDDDDANTYEGADEICDGLVNECGGTLPDDESDLDDDLYVECEFHTDGWQGDEDIVGDEDCDDDDDEEYPGVTWYADSDKDGYGDSTSTSECQRKKKSDVLVAGDCDDDDEWTYTGAAEICDGQVNNCGKGAIPADEIDGDDDKYVECTIHESGWDGDSDVVGGEDCDDEDAAEYPGVTWYPDGDEDGYGTAASSSDCERAEDTDVTNTDDCEDGDGTVYPAASELCDGLKNDCDAASLPADEVDDDEDTYVECTIDDDGWDGDDAVEGGGDCDDDDDDEYPGVLWYPDTDDDGYGDDDSSFNVCERAAASDVTNNRDCAPTDGTVYPGAVALCDGVINDCDGSTLPDDEVDGDGDGFVECDIDTGGWDGVKSVTGGGDCDDTEITWYPGADEYCDTFDNDCDDVVDEDDAVDALVWYLDSDDDGYGDITSETRSCDQPSGYMAVGGDCDDTRADINPDADEIWYDGTDQDCDGASDFDQDYDTHDKEGLGGDDCNDTDDTVYPGADEVFGDSVDQNCDGVDWSTEANTRDWDGGGEVEPPTGCGCGHGGLGAGWLVLGLVGLFGVRRRRAA